MNRGDLSGAVLGSTISGREIRVENLLVRGWKVLGGISTAAWLVGLLPPAIVSGAMTWWAVISGLAPVEIVAITFVVFAVMFLAMLGAVGIGSEASTSNRRNETNSFGTSHHESGPPPVIDGDLPWIHVDGPDPKYICNFYEGRMTTEADRLAKPYIGQKITIQGTLNNVSGGENFSLVYFSHKKFTDIRPIMTFRAENKTKIDIQHYGAKLVVTGDLEKASKYEFHLDNCDFHVAAHN